MGSKPTSLYKAQSAISQVRCDMVIKLFNLKRLLILFNFMLPKRCNKPYYNSHRKGGYSSASSSHSDTRNCHPFAVHQEETLSSRTLMFHVEGALLRSSSTFPYFMLVAFEAGSPVRALILLLLYPLVCLVGKDVGLKIMVFVSFVGTKVDSFRIGRSVLPKFFLEDVGYEGFDFVMRFGEKVAVSELPRVMVEGFLTRYLGIETVVGRELKVVNGYFMGIMEAEKARNFVSKEIVGEPQSGGDVIGFLCFNESLNQHLSVHCKAAYLVSEAEKRTWQVLPREKYPKPLVFHDGRLAFRPTPLAMLAMFMWLPFGFILFPVRAILGLLLPFEISLPLLCLTGMKGTLLKPKASNSNNNNPNPEGKPKGKLYVCNHKTLFDPLYASVAVMRPVTAVTYSLSRAAEIFAPIKTARLTRNRDRDFKLIRELLSQGDLVICPEGTTCREPYLLRFSPLFAEVSDHIVPMAINFEAGMFHATTASGFKCLDPVFLLINPIVTCTVKILDMVPESLTCGRGGKSKHEVANYVQAQIAKALDFECTNLSRRDKYMFLAGNEGIV